MTAWLPPSGGRVWLSLGSRHDSKAARILPAQAGSHANRRTARRGFLLQRRIFCFGAPETGLTFRSVKRWFDRSFDSGLPVADAPRLIDRLRATPDRLAAALEDLPPRVRIYKPEGRWSVQEHAGHLLDLEELWARRLDDFEAGREVLHPADLQNRRTTEARHNERDHRSLVAAFR